MSADRDFLAEVGEALYGDEWRRAMARELGPHHPRGARATIDPGLVTRWASGDRPVPAWVRPALGEIIERRIKRVRALQVRLGMD